MPERDNVTPAAIARPRQAQGGNVAWRGSAPPWTPQEEVLLSELWAQGLEVEEIAEVLGRTSDAVRMRKSKIGLPPRARRTAGPRGAAVWTADDDARLTELWEKGVAAPEIATELGRTLQAIANRRARLGLEAAGRADAWRPEEDERLERLRDEGYTNEEIVREIGRSPSSVEERALRLGLETHKGRPRGRSRRRAPVLYPPTDRAEARQPAGATYHRALPGPARTCQYLGDGDTFCDAPSVPGRSYCAEHAAICYGRPHDADEEESDK